MMFYNTAGLGQREPPRLVLKVGGTSTFQTAMSGKFKVPSVGGEAIRNLAGDELNMS